MMQSLIKNDIMITENARTSNIMRENVDASGPMVEKLYQYKF